VPAIDLDGSKRDEIVLSTEGIIQYAFGTYKRNDVRGNIFEPRLDLGSGFRTNISWSERLQLFLRCAAARSNRPAADQLVPYCNAAPVVVNGQIWMVMNTVDTGTGRGPSIGFISMRRTPPSSRKDTLGDATQSFVFPSIAANHDGDVVIGFNAVGPGPGPVRQQLRGGRQRLPAGKRSSETRCFLKRGRASYQLPTDVGVASWGDYSRTDARPRGR